MTRGRARRLLAVLMVVGGTALLLAPPVVAQDAVRTQTDLFGYDLEADAAPLSIRFFEDFIPIPTDPGDPQFELTASYTNATLGTGPQGRGVASSLWPGPAVGDGFGTVVGDESQTYPVRAAARYPGAGEDDWEGQQSIQGAEGFGMRASARGLDVTATSEGGGLPGPAEAVASFGQIRSESTTTVREGQAVASSLSSISELALLEGVVVLHGVTTELTATSDGETATTEGGTSVAAVEVMGQRVRLTGEGVEVVPADDGGDDGDTGGLGDVLDPVNQILQRLTDDLVADGIEETLGIHVEALDQEETVDGAIAERTASGVKVTIDLRVLRDYLQPLIDQVPLGELLDLVPDNDGTTQLKGLLFELLGLGPTMEVIVGRGLVATSATPPFELPDTSPPPLPPTTGGTSAGGTAVPPATGVSVPEPTTSGPSAVPSADVAPPEVSSPESGPTLAATDPPEPFQGIPVAFAGVALLLAAVPTYGLTSLREAAVGTSSNVNPPRRLPDLRGGA